MHGLKGSRQTGTRERQPGDMEPNPSLCPKLANTGELTALGYVPMTVKADIHTVIPVHKGKKNTNQRFQ